MNQFGNRFRISIFGESHGSSIGFVLDGCPAGIPIHIDDFIEDINRRKPKKKGTTNRRELDFPKIISGVFKGFSTGSPICISFENSDIKSNDYDLVNAIPRPSHADFAANKKFHGFNDYRGGGHFSGRLTLCIVAAGVIAKKVLKDIKIHAELIEIAGQKQFDSIVEEAMKEQDSVGGIVECKVAGLPVGIGEPFFESMESKIAQLAFSIPGVKGIEFGAGFKGTLMKGSEFNDLIIDEKGTTSTNHSGGINAGMTNGNELIFRLAVRPTASISKIQKTFDMNSKSMTTLQIKGRHDTCIALRVPVIAVAIAAIAIADFIL